MALKPNVNLDAILVHASMSGGFEKFCFAAMNLGFKGPDEALKRADWLKKQPKAYVDQVVAKVQQMEAAAE